MEAWIEGFATCQQSQNQSQIPESNPKTRVRARLSRGTATDGRSEDLGFPPATRFDFRRQTGQGGGCLW